MGGGGRRRCGAVVRGIVEGRRHGHNGLWLLCVVFCCVCAIVSSGGWKGNRSEQMEIDPNK